MGSFHFLSRSVKKKKAPRSLSIWVGSRALVAREGVCVCVLVYVCEGRGGVQLGLLTVTLQLQLYPQGEEQDPIDHVKNGSQLGFLGGRSGGHFACAVTKAH